MTDTDMPRGRPPFDRRWLIAIGIVSLLGGVLAFLNPFIASLTVEALAGGAFLVAGAGQIWMAFSDGTDSGWGRVGSAVLGALLILFAVLLVLNPLAGLVSLTLLAAAFFLAFGVVRTAMAIRMRGREGWGWLLAAGLLSILLGVVIFLGLPGAAFGILGLFLGIELLGSGIGALALAFSSRRDDRPGA